MAKNEKNQANEAAELRMQMVMQEAKEIKQQISLLAAQYNELFNILNSLEAVQGKKGQELLGNLGGGVFFKADLKDAERMLVNVGAGVVVEEDIGSLKARVNAQLIEIEAVINELETGLQKRVDEILRLQGKK